MLDHWVSPAQHVVNVCSQLWSFVPYETRTSAHFHRRLTKQLNQGVSPAVDELSCQLEPTVVVAQIASIAGLNRCLIDRYLASPNVGQESHKELAAFLG